MQDLQQLNSCGSPYPIVVELSVISSPVSSRAQYWKNLLARHPDQRFADYIISGIREGFRIGFCWHSHLKSTTRNIPSAYEHPDVVDKYLEAEQKEANVIGPLASATLPNGQSVHVSRIGIIPKGHKWRLITDLSFPVGRSINDGINPRWCSLEYTTVDKVAAVAMSLGVGALMAKVDIKAAYRIIPVHPLDRPLLGITWRGQIFIDTKLPFGLRSAPKIFNAVADAFEWCLRDQGVSYIDHYLDDFITLGPQGSDVCANNLRLIYNVAASLGVPLAEDKSVGPTSALTFLGIRIDTEAATLSLPKEKLDRLQLTLDRWTFKKSCRRRDLESLIGLLHHAAKVIPPGRSFLQRMIAHLRGRSRDNQFIRLNKEFRSDLIWWKVFSKVWNGVSIIQQTRKEVRLVTDASGSWGCGAIWEDRWFQLQWAHENMVANIAFKELVPIIIAVMIWGHFWRGSHLLCFCDNAAVVAIIASRYSKQSELMHLLRCLFFLEAYFDLHISASHIPGHTNIGADQLSRNYTQSFLLQNPLMKRQPSPLPLMAMDLIMGTHEWSSPAWIRLFKSIVG